ncbi:hypothetical protein PHAVU_001G253600 [Phaseolus vulgaris]|uniref:Uncharacterized protein n=1 Tax=Phaseolus vulgaris TaxID=3885 RepID=V7D2D6_PHAVU|nr:hypothetical protein PHAVU_001G253600g [Phaseolus vulgaris]ESW35660.1 hypothetical protein PHAVU_001G253600g [Phaseolus vulgaris]
MQKQYYMKQYDKKMKQTGEQMRKVEQERDQAFDELRHMKRIAQETNVMIDETLANKRSNSESLLLENQKSVQESPNNKLSEKDVLLDNMRNEMNNLRSSEDNAMTLLSGYKRRIQELEIELNKTKESEANLFDTLVMQTKQLEQNKILLEESKLEITSLEEKLMTEQLSACQTFQIPEIQNNFPSMQTGDKMKVEAELEKEMFNSEELSEKVKIMLEELVTLKSELKLATEAEENSKKAMDDLAFALKEVATEANQVKAKLTLSQVELEHTKEDAERWRIMLGTTEERYKDILELTRKESDKNKNTVERLRSEAEESLLAWNVKEIELVNCIKRAEEERLHAKHESTEALEALKEVENKVKVSKEENQKLRDILKQALNEANVAKEGAEIAKAENARLQDSINLLVHENEMLKIHEVASFENIKELKRMLSESSIKDLKNEDIDKLSGKESGKEDNNNSNFRETGRRARTHSNFSMDHREHKESKSLNKTFSLNLKEMITPHSHKQQHNKITNEELNKDTNKDSKDTKDTGDDTLRGSIFDEIDSSDSESRQDMDIPDDFDHLDESHFDDPEGDRNSRKRRALLRRFGNLIRRRGYHNHNHNHRKEPSNEEHLQT